MEIRLGDTIKDSRGREGVLTNIGIATSKSDVAGEQVQMQKNMIPT